jgi:hypothetical protein
MACAATALTVLALAFPSFAAAAPSCPPSATIPDVHSGFTQSTTVSCDDPGGTGLNWATDSGDDAQHGFVQYDQFGTVSYTANADYKGPDS